MTLRMNQNGAMLLEVLLSVTILAVALTLLIKAMTASARAVSLNADHTQAVFLAENKMFDLMSGRFIDHAYQEDGQFPVPFEQFRYEIGAAPVLDERVSPEKINEVRLDVLWSRGKRIAVSTYLFEDPET